MRTRGVSEEVRQRHAWLELLQVSGPFLTLPVAHRVFPNGLPEVPVQRRAAVRGLIAQMMDDRGATRHPVITAMLRDVPDWRGATMHVTSVASTSAATCHGSSGVHTSRAKTPRSPRAA